MEKTIEEIRPIVLAYCNAICKTMDDSVYWSEDQTVNIHGSDDTYIATCGGVVVPIRQSMQDRIWLAAYRLFGLETRELETKISTANYLIDQLRAKIADQHFDLKADRANSAKWQSRAWKILSIVRKRESEQRPKTANVLKSLRECGAKLEAERAKTAKLVDEIGYISEANRKHNWPYDDPHQIAEDINQMMNALENALEAHKKGGANG